MVHINLSGTIYTPFYCWMRRINFPVNPLSLFSFFIVLLILDYIVHILSACARIHIKQDEFLSSVNTHYLE